MENARDSDRPESDPTTRPAAKAIWKIVAVADEIEPGTTKEVVVGGHLIAVFRQGDDWYALDGMCAHQGGPIAQGQVSRTDQNKLCVTCPWHGWQYELESGIQTVNRQPLQQVFPVRVRDGNVEVAVDP
jgi:NAD(P)H-dependent nitrite reductase small subunit